MRHGRSGGCRAILAPIAAAILVLLAGQAARAADPEGFWTRPTLLGDPAGLRAALAAHGVVLGLTETSEVFGNVSGGIHRGADYDGLTTLSLDIGTAKALGWAGGQLHASALQIHGRSLSADNLATLQTASGIEASDTTRLWELWYQQAIPGGAVDLRIGQQSIDNEFITSRGSGLFINTVMGWPMVPSADLYAGGPAYPLSSLGARLRARPVPGLTVLAGVFDDNPPGGRFAADGQLRGREADGLGFSFNTGALWIMELQFRLRPGNGLSGTYKLGFWYDSGSFPDQRVDSTGRSLADPASTGLALMHRGNDSLYAVADQTVWRPDPHGARAIDLFARVMAAPADRNLISFSANGGITLSAPFPGRDDDTLGIGFGIARVSPAAAALDRETASFSGGFVPVRGTETFLELTYQAQITPWWQVQPDFQYVFHPGGGVADPAAPGRAVGDEAVFGVRTMVTF